MKIILMELAKERRDREVGWNLYRVKYRCKKCNIPVEQTLYGTYELVKDTCKDELCVNCSIENRT